MPDMIMPNTGDPTTQGMPQGGPQGSPQETSEPGQVPPVQGNPNQQGVQSDGTPQADPKMIEKGQNYVSILMNELHSPETRDDVLQILKSSKDPFVTIPQAALVINDAAKNKVERSGGKVDIKTQFLGSQYLVGDLMEIGNAYGVFQVGKNDFKDLYQDSLQMFIQRGLKDGSIDPIELQLTGEKLMNQNQKIGGQYLAQQNGLPYAPQQTQVMQQLEVRTKQKTLADEANRRSLEAKQQNDAQVRQALLQAQQGGK